MKRAQFSIGLPALLIAACSANTTQQRLVPAALTPADRLSPDACKTWYATNFRVVGASADRCETTFYQCDGSVIGATGIDYIAETVSWTIGGVTARVPFSQIHDRIPFRVGSHRVVPIANGSILEKLNGTKLYRVTINPATHKMTVYKYSTNQSSTTAPVYPLSAQSDVSDECIEGILGMVIGYGTVALAVLGSGPTLGLSDLIGIGIGLGTIAQGAIQTKSCGK